MTQKELQKSEVDQPESAQTTGNRHDEKGRQKEAAWPLSGANRIISLLLHQL
jgi:hypothetical protein